MSNLPFIPKEPISYKSALTACEALQASWDDMVAAGIEPRPEAARLCRALIRGLANTWREGNSHGR